MKRYAFEGDQFENKKGNHVMGSVMFTEDYQIVQCSDSRFRLFDGDGEVISSLIGLL